MDSTLVSVLLPTVTDLVAKQVPGLVASHPKTSLAAMTLYAILEWVWPRLPIKGGSTPDVLFHALAAGVKAVLRKKG